MGGLQSSSTDDVYCVYCNAPAAGQCSVCMSPCCADCVELVVGLTSRQAVCNLCLRVGSRPAGGMTLLREAWPLALIVLGLFALVVTLWG